MFAEDYCPKWPEWPCNGVATTESPRPQSHVTRGMDQAPGSGKGGSGPLEIWSGQEQLGRTGHIQRDNQLYQPFDEFLVIPCWVPVTAALRRLANTMILHTVQNSMSATERTQVMAQGWSSLGCSTLVDLYHQPIPVLSWAEIVWAGNTMVSTMVSRVRSGSWPWGFWPHTFSTCSQVDPWQRWRQIFWRLDEHRTSANANLQL